MPSIELSPIEAQVVLLAVQKRNAQQQAAQAAFDQAAQQFVADIALISKAHGLPADAEVKFHVENGAGTASWPDIAPPMQLDNQVVVA